MVKRNQQIWHESLEGDGYSINKELTKLTRRCINCFLTWFVQTQQNLLTVLINSLINSEVTVSFTVSFTVEVIVEFIVSLTVLLTVSLTALLNFH